MHMTVAEYSNFAFVMYVTEESKVTAREGLHMYTTAVTYIYTILYTVSDKFKILELTYATLFSFSNVFKEDGRDINPPNYRTDMKSKRLYIGIKELHCSVF